MYLDVKIAFETCVVKQREGNGEGGRGGGVSERARTHAHPLHRDNSGNSYWFEIPCALDINSRYSASPFSEEKTTNGSVGGSDRGEEEKRGTGEGREGAERSGERRKASVKIPTTTTCKRTTRQRMFIRDTFWRVDAIPNTEISFVTIPYNNILCYVRLVKHDYKIYIYVCVQR